MALKATQNAVKVDFCLPKKNTHRLKLPVDMYITVNRRLTPVSSKFLQV